MKLCALIVATSGQLTLSPHPTRCARFVRVCVTDSPLSSRKRRRSCRAFSSPSATSNAAPLLTPSAVAPVVGDVKTCCKPPVSCERHYSVKPGADVALQLHGAAPICAPIPLRRPRSALLMTDQPPEGRAARSFDGRLFGVFGARSAMRRTPPLAPVQCADAQPRLR